MINPFKGITFSSIFLLFIASGIVIIISIIFIRRGILLIKRYDKSTALGLICIVLGISSATITITGIFILLRTVLRY